MANTCETDVEEITPPTGASRRSFLKGVGAVTAGGVMATMQGTVFHQSASAASVQATNVLIVLNQRGGSDGLSIVVPYGDKHYATMRPTIGILPSALLQTNGMFGLHPNLEPVEHLWKSGRMAAVHAVGAPTPDLSHVSATVAVEEADPGSEAGIGWVNRMVGMTDAEGDFAATQVGESVPHSQIDGPECTLCAVDVENIQVAGAESAMAQRIAALDVTWDQASGPVGEAARAALETAEQWLPVLQTSAEPQNGAVYPETDLGDALAQSARVIRSGVGVHVITVDHSGWDMHAGLGTLTTGTMHIMVDELATAVSAFFTDLGGLGDNVTMVTISEFGRRVHENGDAGADHGWGNAMLLFGGGVNGGYYGTWPGLTGKTMTEGNLTVTTDYRSVLAEVIRTRFPDVTISELFPDFDPVKVGVMQG
jgi:uncharacterized protein (DUF1501 family)